MEAGHENLSRLSAPFEFSGSVARIVARPLNRRGFGSLSGVNRVRCGESIRALSLSLSLRNRLTCSLAHVKRPLCDDVADVDAEICDLLLLKARCISKMFATRSARQFGNDLRHCYYSQWKNIFHG